MVSANISKTEKGLTVCEIECSKMQRRAVHYFTREVSPAAPLIRYQFIDRPFGSSLERRSIYKVSKVRKVGPMLTGRKSSVLLEDDIVVMPYEYQGHM